jgi:mannose-1-phosphate guanylyltransferase/mannose-6-phosphate isomerase
MLHTVILAGSDVSVDQTRAELPMFLEQSTGTTSRFRSVVQAVTGDVFSTPTVVTTLSTADAVSSQLKQDGSRGALLLEPDAHKPAAAMLAALMHMRQSPESLVLFLPASMDFKSPEELDIALCHAIPAAQRGEVVVLSARTPAAGRATPSFEVSQAPRLNKPVAVDRVASAGQSFLDGLFRRGHIVWSTGVVLARVDVLLAAYKRNASRMFLTVKEAVRTACNVREGVLLAEAAYNQLKPVVFEAVVSAKTSHLVTIPTGAALSEFNLWDEDLSDERKGRFELSQTPEPQPWRAAQVLSVFDGSEGVAASKQLVFTPGETNSQEWGARELLAQNGPLTLQRLSIAPGARLELNPHRYEAEQWIVLQGSALIGVGGQMKLLMENQSMRVPAGCLRSVENPGQSVLQLVQLRFDPTPATPSPETIGAA